MRNAVLSLVVTMLLLLTSCGLTAAKTDLDGIKPGKWTMDFDAAKKLASEKKQPILLNFSGSDWCGWCKLMEKNVFSKRKWKNYAKENILMVIIDFPNDDSIVPQKYVERNQELKEKYRVEGFPTFVVLDDDAGTVLGKLSAGQDKTPESFIGELQMLLRYRAVEVAEYSKTLSSKDRLAYLKIVDQMKDANKAIKDQEQQVAAAQKKIESLQENIVELEETATELRVANLDAGKLKQHNKLKAEMEEAKKKLADFFSTEPEHTQENEEKFHAMKSEIQAFESKLSGY